MRRSIGALVGLGLAIAAPAHATFHLWQVNEVYSNADGSVQFIEFFTTFGFQQFLIAHNIQTSTEGVPDSIYTIPNSLEVGVGESTADRHFLFASPGFEEVTGVAPDYEWTGALSFIHVGTNDFVELVDANGLSLANLPTDAVHSLAGDGVTLNAIPTPTNFAGEVGTVPEPAGLAAGITALVTLAAASRRR